MYSHHNVTGETVRSENSVLNRMHDVQDLSPLTIFGTTLWAHINPEDLDILRWSMANIKPIELHKSRWLTVNQPSLQIIYLLTTTLTSCSSSELSRRRTLEFPYLYTDADTELGNREMKYSRISVSHC